MAVPTVITYAIPSGGAVLLSLPDYEQPIPDVTTITVARGIAGGDTWTTLYSGAPLLKFLDVGDGLPGPLDQATNYVWQVTDERGTTTTAGVTPSSSISTQPDEMTQMLIKLLQGGLNGLTLPPGYGQPPNITIEFPRNGFQAMPFIVLNPELIQQSEVGIGEDVPNPDQNNNWSLWANVTRMWRVTVMCTSAEERDYYRDSLLGIFRVVKATAFAPIGQNVSQRFQAHSYPDVQEWEGKTPGFYAADLMLEVDGIFPTAVITGYGLIEHIDATVTTPAPVAIPAAPTGGDVEVFFVIDPE